MTKDNNKTPLEETFGLHHCDEIPGMLTVELPDDPALADIVRLALEAYKEQMENIQLMEPKYRPRALEVAQQYLNLAMSTLAKKEDIRLKDDKANMGKKPVEDSPIDGGMKRSEVLKLINGGKK